ncbi:ubiquitin carboxyl-terminal hydrolase 8-like protein [Dinothrombium tinctorium]|uniref:ubiquitinyl hydrolase 1 n=1 Tax=Dinothrombium tinctorium TaxID=1965070 RepID=A0A3S3P554_9ACAR|nr:ubiquitin carboxyl-terminal hydrolase 8-like protein [Dinothrombium tinctorium]
MPVRNSPPKTVVKKLYLANSVKELNGFVDRSTIDINKWSPNVILKSILKSYEAAVQELNKGDEERAYLLFMRTVNAYLKMKEMSDARKDNYYDLMFSKTKLQDCVENCERLMKSLSRRYEALQESTRLVHVDDKESKNNVNSHSSSDTENAAVNAAEEPQASDPVMNNSPITCTELYDLIDSLNKSCKDNNLNSETILLIDARSAKDYNESSFKLDKFKYVSDKVIVVNVPEEILEPGLSIKKLESKLSQETINALKHRRLAKKVILFDWLSKDLNESEKLESLFMTLWKWDNSVERLKVKPIILKGGYEDWVLTYPMFTTNSKVSAPRRNSNASPKRQLNLIYDQAFKSLEEEAPKPKEPVVNGYEQHDGDVENSFRQSMADRVNNLLPDNPNIKAPGSAKIVPHVDRSRKPTLKDQLSSKNRETLVKPETENAVTFIGKEQTTKQDELEEIKQQEELNRSRMKQLEEDNKKKEEEVQKLREQNLKLIRNFKPSVSSKNDQESKDSVKQSSPTNVVSHIESQVFENEPNDMLASKQPTPSQIKYQAIGGDENKTHFRRSNEIRPTTERTLSESTSSHTPKSPHFSVGSSLSRSHSSPNIAQLLEEEGETNLLSKSKSTTNPPQFDRSLKPTSFPLNKPVSASIAKSRDFAPKYGISGQAITGLRNLGNTCFMNSVIQCLSSTIDLAVYFTQELYMPDINQKSKFGSNGEIAEELAILIKQMWTCQYKSLSPKDFKKKIGLHMPVFVGNDQQDAHEFLVMLLEKLHADLNRKNYQSKPFEIKDDVATHIAMNSFWKHHVSTNESIISELFEGLLLSTLTCNHCGKTSNSFEVFSCLSLPIPTNFGNRCKLEDCLKLFSEPERMSGEAGWDCPICKVKRDAMKKIVICRLPRVLLIHLKRFSYEGMWRQKLQTSIEFPLSDLNLKNYRYVNQNDVTQQSLTYDLYAVVNHYGTLEGGHYVAYCKHASTKRWYKFDDHEVTELSAADVKTQAAYILFYTSIQS